MCVEKLNVGKCILAALSSWLKCIGTRVKMSENPCFQSIFISLSLSLSLSLAYPHLTSMARVKKCSLEHVFRLDDKTADTNRLRRMLHRHFAFITAAEKKVRSLSLSHYLHITPVKRWSPSRHPRRWDPSSPGFYFANKQHPTFMNVEVVTLSAFCQILVTFSINVNVKEHTYGLEGLWQVRIRRKLCRPCIGM